MKFVIVYRRNHAGLYTQCHLQILQNIIETWYTIGAVEISIVSFAGLEAVTNVKANTTTLSWTQLANTASDGCISGYIISWTEGEHTTVGSSTSALVSTLNNFPFCKSRTVMVTPNTPSGRLTVGTSLQNVIFEHPGT